MIDGFEVAVPATSGLSKRWLRRNRPSNRSEHLGQMDCRPELSAIVYEKHRFRVAPERQHFTVEFKDVRNLTAYDIAAQLRLLFPEHGRAIPSLRVKRIDLAVDCSVPVDWFYEHCHVRCKQATGDYEKPRKEVRRGRIETVTWGKNDDVYRIYDKIQQLKDTGEKIPQYYFWFAGNTNILPTPDPLVTRIERQCRGAGVPSPLATVGLVFKNALAFQPFDRLEIDELRPEPETKNWDPQRWLMNLGLQTAVRQFGRTQVRQRLQRSGNAWRIFKNYGELLKTDDGFAVRVSNLQIGYQYSTREQLNLPNNGRFPTRGAVSCCNTGETASI